MPTQIACPSCEESYHIEPARLPARRVRVACLACGEGLYLRLVEVAAAAAPAGAGGEEEVPIWKEPRRDGGAGMAASSVGSAAPAPAAPAPAVDRPLAPYLDPPVAARPAASAAAPVMEPPAAPRFERPAAPPVMEPPAAPRFERPSAPPVMEPPAAPRFERPSAPPVIEPPAAPRFERPSAPPVMEPVQRAPVAEPPAAPPEPFAAPQPVAPRAPAERPGPPATGRRGAFTFAEVGDASARAQRLARALVSDILVYQPKKVEQGIRDANLKELLREEVEKSWDEYCERLGPEVARANRQQFVAALNEILARGNPVF